MPPECKFEITFYFVERRETDKPPARFLIYSRSIQVDTDVYLASAQSEEEVRIPLVDTEAISRWVPIDLIVKRMFKSSKEHDEFLKSLRAGELSLPLVGPEGNRRGFQVIPRPNILQFDADTVQHGHTPLTPESGLSVMARVESFWPKNKEKILKDALDPIPESCFESDMSSSTSDLGPGEETQLLIIDAERELNHRLQRLVDELTRLTGLSFGEAYAERLCNVEIIDVPLGAHLTAVPITVHAEKEEKKNANDTPIARIIHICRDQPLVDHDLYAHVILRNNGEVLLDRLVHLLQGQQESDSIRAEEAISEYEVRVFDPSSDNRLIFIKSCYLVREIRGTGLIRTGTKTYRDQLAAKLSHAHSKLGQRLEAATPFHPTQMIAIGGHAHDPWVDAARSLRHFIGARTSRPKKSRWFPRGLTEHGEALDFIREIVDRPQNREVLIADPFFGLTAFGLLIPRLRHAGLQLTVITSCLGWDPDKEEARGKSAEWELKSKKQRESIRRWCNENTALIATNLRIIDVRDGSDQAFHDRYVVCIDDKEDVSAFSLSNSLNKIAGKFPCCMAEVEQPVAREVYTYLRGLESGYNLSVPNFKLGKKLDSTEIWDSSEARAKRRDERFESKRISENGPRVFPFWKSTISWLLGLDGVEESTLIERAAEEGLIRRNTKTAEEWCASEQKLPPILKQAWSKLPSESTTQAELLAGLGELQAHAPAGLDIAATVADLIRKNGKNLDVHAILTHLEDYYSNRKPPEGFQGVSPPVEALSAAHYLHEEERASFGLLLAAEGFLEAHYEVQVRGLYGFRWVIQLLLVTDPSSTLACIEQKSQSNAHVCATILAAVVNSVMEGQETWVLDSLLHSNLPFLKMMGVAILFWDGWRQVERRRPVEHDKVIATLQAAGFPDEDVLWLAALPVSKAQVAEFRSVDLPSEDSNRKAAEEELSNLLANLADILSRAQPDEYQLSQLDQALRFSARDCYSIARGAEERAASGEHGPWEKMYQRCVDDIEVLIGRRPGPDFHFYDKTDFDKLDIGAQAFMRLNRGKVAKRFRNRLQSHIEELALVASDPLAPQRDYMLWHNTVGRCAAGCLFGFLVFQHAVRSGEKDYIAEAVGKLIAATCQLQIGASKGWHDLAGLLDNLAKETAWAVVSLSDVRGVDIAHQAASDERLLPFFRACLACVPTAIFERDPDRAFSLLEHHADPKEARNVIRYFYLLDFVLCNSYKAHFDRRRGEEAVSQGLSNFPDIDSIWQWFFRNAWDAMTGDAEKKSQILGKEETARSYCGMLLREGEHHG